MVKKSEVKVKQFRNFISKQVTIYPDRDDQLFDYKQVKAYVTKQTKDLPEDAHVIVRGLNILRDSTLKSYGGDMMDEEVFYEYTKGKVKDDTKFKYFRNFTITVKEPNRQGNMFTGRKKN